MRRIFSEKNCFRDFFAEKYFCVSFQEIPIIFLSGPRQSGKTTLAKSVFPSYKYINLERPDERLLTLRDPDYFLTTNGEEGIVIDEAQRAPELFSYIQGIVDENPESKFVLTGSQNFLLSKEVSQSLAGRVRILNLLPLSALELFDAGYKSKNAFSYLLDSLDVLHFLFGFLFWFWELKLQERLGLLKKDYAKEYLALCTF